MTCGCTGACRRPPYRCPSAARQPEPASFGRIDPLPAPLGCICPAGANRDCRNPLCPRQAPPPLLPFAVGLAQPR